MSCYWPRGPDVLGNGLSRAARLKLIHRHVSRLKALRPLYDIEVHGLPLFEGTAASCDNSRIMDEYLAVIYCGNEAIPLGIAKPLDCA